MTTSRLLNNSALLDGYGVGPIHLVGSETGLYDRHLLLDKVIAAENTGMLTRAPANDALFGGLKVTTHSGRFAARPYAEGFDNGKHLNSIFDESQDVVDCALDGEALA